MAFYVGQKVCAVSDPLDGHNWFVNPRHPFAAKIANQPSVGETYTVQAVFVSPIDNIEYLRLKEVANPALSFTEGVMEPAWPASRFRPITERKTDISIFKAMLNPSKTEVTA